jgi:hypothetical protein
MSRVTPSRRARISTRRRALAADVLRALQAHGVPGRDGFYHPLEYALSKGLEHVYLGIDVYEPKVRRGAALTPLRTCVWCREQDGAAFLRDWLSLVDRRNSRYFAELVG